MNIHFYANIFGISAKLLYYSVNLRGYSQKAFICMSASDNNLPDGKHIKRNLTRYRAFFRDAARNIYHEMRFFDPRYRLSGCPHFVHVFLVK